MRIALYEPDIPQNAGTLMRLAACLGVGIDVIEPAGFDTSDRALKRAGMDYLALAEIRGHVDWAAFEVERRRQGRRLILLTTRAELGYTEFQFTSHDTLLLGRESAGVPERVHAAVDAKVRIPMRADLRSLNVAVAAAMVVGEALRQTGGFA